MKCVELLCIFVLVMVAMPTVSAANSTESFDEITDGLFDDVESFLKTCVLGLVSIFALGSVIAIFGGWFGHNESLFKKGVKGCGIIILGAVAYFIAINGFYYVVDNYW